MNKNNLIIKILLWIIIIFINSLHTYAWCFWWDNINRITDSSNECIKSEVIETCQRYLLKIKSNCVNIYYMEGDNWEKRTLEKYHPTDDQLKTINIEKDFTVYDTTLPGDKIWKWERKLVNITDSKDIIYIKWENSHPNSYYFHYYMIKEIIITLFILLFIFLLVKNIRKNK